MASQQVRMLVTIDGVAHEVVSTPFDQDRLEEWLRDQNDGVLPTVDRVPLKRSETFLAWSVLDRKGLTELSFDEFRRAVEDIETAEPRPLAGGGNASSPSPPPRAVRRASSRR